MRLCSITTSIGACSLMPAISWPKYSRRVAMREMSLSSMRENTHPRCPTIPFWPQSRITLRRTTWEPTCSRLHPVFSAEKTDSSWYW